jgi:hypothetical protein
MPDQPRDIPSVIPMLSYEDVAQAADWVARAFGFRETGRWTDADGHVTHVTMELGRGVVMLGSPSPHYRSPRHHAEVCDLAYRPWAPPFSPRRRTILVSVSGTTGPRTSRATAGCSLNASDLIPWDLTRMSARPLPSFGGAHHRGIDSVT